MMRRKASKNLVRVLTLSLVLAGVTGSYLTRSAAAANDATATVTADGTFNSIKVSSGRQADGYIYGIYNTSSTPLAITLEGDKIIEVKDTGKTGVNDKSAFAYGVLGAAISGDGVQIKASAAGDAITITDATASPNVQTYSAGVLALMQGKNTFDNNVSITAEAQGRNITGTIDGDDITFIGYTGAYGIGAQMGGTNTLGDNANVTALATGGTIVIQATSPHDEASAIARVDVEGIFAGTGSTNTLGNNASIKAVATGGQATNEVTTNVQNNRASSADAVAEAHGISSRDTGVNSVGDNASINVDATGGQAHTEYGGNGSSAYAYAYSYGVAAEYGAGSNTLGKNVSVNVTATGGKATNNATGSGNTVAVGVAYGVDARYKGTNTIGDNASVNATATGGLATDDNANHGVYTYAYASGLDADGGTNTFTGAVTIKAAASVQTAGARFGAESMYAGGETDNGTIYYGTNNLTATGKTKTLEGDVYADTYGTNNLVLDTADSYLQGNIVSGQYNTTDPFGVNNVTISNGATWRPVYDNRYGTDCNEKWEVIDTTKNVATNTVDTRTVTSLILKDGGKVDLLWDGSRDTYRNINFDTLSGNGGEFYIKTDLNSETNGDKISVTTGESGSTQYIAVDDVSLTSGATVISNKKLLVATDASGNYKFAGRKLDTGGLWETEATIENLEGNNWYLTMFKASPNGIANSLIGTVESGYGTWRNTITDDTLRKRLGDLRFSGEDISGVWARVKAGKLSADTYDGSYQMYQVGVDKKKGNKAYGLAIDYGRSSNDLASGTTDGSNTGLSLYATTYHDSGLYNDIVFRAGRLSSDMEIGGAYAADDMDYKAWGYSLGYEVGKTFRKDSGWYVEPQAQLIYGHLRGGDETSARGFKVSRDNINSFIGRLGFTLGRRINKDSDYYFKANLYHEFGGNGDIHLSYDSQKMNYEGDHKDTWLEMGLGTNVKLNNNTYLYGDVLKTFGADIQKKWQINAGMRWTWGK